MNFVHQQFIDHYNDWLTNVNQNHEVISNNTEENSDLTINPIPGTSNTNVTPTSTSEAIPSTSSTLPSTIFGSGEKNNLKIVSMKSKFLKTTNLFYM